MRKVMNMWIDHPVLDGPISLGLAILLLRFNAQDFLEVTDHSGLYQTAVGAAIGIFSMGTIGISLLVAVPPQSRFNAAIVQVGPNLVSLVFACLTGLLLSGVLFSVLYFLDSADVSSWRVAVFTFGLVLISSNTGRLVWLLKRIVTSLI